MNISDLNISIRDINAISRSGCTTVDELRQKLSDDPDGMRRQLGSGTLDRIEDALVDAIKGNVTEIAQAITKDEFNAISESLGNMAQAFNKADELDGSQPAVIVSGDYTRAVTLTRSIIANAQAAQQSLYEVCKGLKEMRDGKLYKELGYANFEEYTENEVGIKRAHAYRYLSIAEGLTEDFVSSMRQIGSTKLALLAKLDEPTREEVTETVDIESVTVKELKEQITALTNDKNKQESEIADLAQQLDAAQETIAGKTKQFEDFAASKNRDIMRISSEKCTISENLRKKSAEYVKAQNRILFLEKQIKELENRPVEVAVSEDEAKEIERLRADLDDAKLRLTQADKTAAAKAEHAAALVRAEYEEKLAQVQSPEPDESALDAARINSFRLIFEELVDELENILEDMDDEPRIKYVKQLDNYWCDNLAYLKHKRGV